MVTLTPIGLKYRMNWHGGLGCVGGSVNDSVNGSVGSPSSSAAQQSRHLHSARNDDGVQCVPCFDALHSQRTRMYCGRLVGRSNYHYSHNSSVPCSVCDCRCGPEGGCQCKSCARLNAEIARRERVSLSRSASHAVHVSFNKSAHAAKKGYQFYCGRTVGRGNYANRCVLCEGKCGPRTGCQCLDCHALEMQYQATRRYSIHVCVCVHTTIKSAFEVLYIVIVILLNLR